MAEPTSSGENLAGDHRNLAGDHSPKFSAQQLPANSSKAPQSAGVGAAAASGGVGVREEGGFGRRPSSDSRCWRCVVVKSVVKLTR